MTAGIPVLLSDLTGTRQVIEEAIPEFVCECDVLKVSEKIIWFYGLSAEQKNSFALKVRRAALFYTEENAVAHYRKIFEEEIKAGG